MLPLIVLPLKTPAREYEEKRRKTKKSEEKRKKTKKNEKKNEKAKKNEKKRKKWENSSNPIYTNPMKNLPNSTKVVMKAVSQSGFALQHAAVELQGDREIVMEAVSRYGPALEFATKELRGDHAPKSRFSAVAAAIFKAKSGDLGLFLCILLLLFLLFLLLLLVVV